MELHFWHNPRCSKSRAALELLRGRGVEPVVRTYLTDPPTTDELTNVLALLGMSPRELMRRDESIYGELGLDKEGVSDADRIAAMVAHPILIQRPIALTSERAVIGRPPDRVLELVD